MYYYEIVFLHIGDIAIGSYDLPDILAEFARRFEITTGDNGATFLGLNVWQDPRTHEITLNLRAISRKPFFDWLPFRLPR